MRGICLILILSLLFWGLVFAGFYVIDHFIWKTI